MRNSIGKSDDSSSEVRIPCSLVGRFREMKNFARVVIILLSEGLLIENSANSLTSNIPLAVTVSEPLLVEDMLKFSEMSPTIEESM